LEFKEQTMTEKTFAKIGTTVYQVIKDGYPAELADTYDNALRRIAIAFAFTSDAFEALGRRDEFPELEAVDLCGTYQQRLRFAIEQSGRHAQVAEHRLGGIYEKTSLVRTIGVTTEFDPGYEVQSGLYRAANRTIDREEVSERLAAVIASKIAFERISKSDDEIVAAIVEASDRLGSDTLGASAAKDATEFLKGLPSLAADRYEELASKVFPQHAMSI
jgi:hypothetical protein